MITINYKIVYCLIVCELCSLIVNGKSLDTVRVKRTVTQNDAKCEKVERFFQTKNISLTTTTENSRPGSFCGGDCCDDKTETLLRRQGQRDFAALLQHNSQSLQGLLTFTATTLQNHVSELARQSENKTLLLFHQVYRRMAVLSQQPINNLYSDMRHYIHQNDSTTNIKETVTNFFTDLFPLVYHHSAQLPDKDFTADYKLCLKKSIDSILPFGDIPKKVSHALTKSLEAARVLLQAFQIGIEVLSTTDTLLIDGQSGTNSECHNALLRMTFCPKCKGYTVRPCAGYCLNVIRGCIAKYVAELDMPWTGYVEGVGSLVNAMKRNNNYDDVGASNVNVDATIRQLDTLISNAIMHAMENVKEIDNRVRRNCGTAKFSQKEDPLKVDTANLFQSGNVDGKPPVLRVYNQITFPRLPETKLEHFLISIEKTKGFYNNLANTLCEDENFAEQKDQHCWNGERIADYTKTVVDVGLNAQKYNPEIKPNADIQNVDGRIANLVDKLRHVHHMALNSVGMQNSDDYMQRDEGSGSGYGPDFNPDGDEEDETRGSGSGAHDIEPDRPSLRPDVKITDLDTNHVADTKTTANSMAPHPSMWLVSVLIVTTKLYI